jgi:hypothetical protein
MGAPMITWDDIEPGDWISTGWGAQHRVRTLSDTHVVLACHGEGDEQRAQRDRIRLGADEDHRCTSCQRAGGQDGLGPARRGIVGEVRRAPEGWIAICVSERHMRWHFVGAYPLGSHGWAEDWFMGNASLIAVIPGTPAATGDFLAALAGAQL